MSCKETWVSSPSGMTDLPVLASVAISSRRIVSAVPASRRRVTLVAFSATIAPDVTRPSLRSSTYSRYVGETSRLGSRT